MSNESLRWRENRAEAEKSGLYPKSRAADLFAVSDCGYYLRSIHASRWSEETRELLHAAREAVVAVNRAMLAEVDR